MAGEDVRPALLLRISRRREPRREPLLHQRVSPSKRWVDCGRHENYCNEDSWLRKMFAWCPPSQTNRKSFTAASCPTAPILEPDADNPPAACIQPKRSCPSADGQTQDAQHAAQPAQSAAPPLPPGGTFDRQLQDGPSPKIAPVSDSAIPSPAQPAPATHPQKAVPRNTAIRREPLADLSPCATAETFHRAANSARLCRSERPSVRAPPRDTASPAYAQETAAPAPPDRKRSSQTAAPRRRIDRCGAQSGPAASSVEVLRSAETKPTTRPNLQRAPPEVQQVCPQ